MSSKPVGGTTTRMLFAFVTSTSMEMNISFARGCSCRLTNKAQHVLNGGQRGGWVQHHTRLAAQVLDL